MRKRISIALILCICTLGYFYLQNVKTESPELVSQELREYSIQAPNFTESEKNESETENPIARLEFEISQLADPTTGEIPRGIREREIAYAESTLNKAANVQPSGAGGFDFGSAAAGTAAAQPFRNVGPFNVGGRTRALGIDIDDENIILAGGIAGGVWKTTNQGTSWTRTTGLQQHPAVSDLVQDRRSGKTDEWYYSTGERRGNSASASGAFYQGNGIYKSTDNGDSWSLLTATAVTGTTGTDVITSGSDFTLIDELAIDYSNASGTEIYAAGTSQIIKSTDGFQTFNVVLGDQNTGGNMCDVIITSGGKVFATIGNSSFNGANGEDGVFMSDDGDNWTNIDPPGLNGTNSRLELGIDPSDENLVYLAGNSQLFVFNDLNDTWTDLSANIDASSDTGEGHATQGGYDLYVAVHPSNDQLIYLGGTNIIRSSNGFGTAATNRQIGGYREDGNSNSFPQYPNHHPDQHAAVFFDSDANKMLTASDGGVHLTNDNTVAGSSTSTVSVLWESLNNGYLTTQFYHADIHNYNIGDPQVVGGLQDNSTFARFTDGDQDAWQDVFGGDGAFSGITYNSMYVSSQNGNLRRLELDNNNVYQSQGNISPTLDDDDYLFINPYNYNPVNQDQLFVAARGRLFVSNDIRTNPGRGDWIELSGPATLTNQFISAITPSTDPEGILYFGTRTGGLFKIENTRNIDANTEIITLERGNLPNANVVGIAVDPKDADNVIVAFSNYNVISLWMSTDGGDTWSSISGNLEENANGTGAGPSVRSVEIMPDGDGGHYYFVGTSVGLFMTKDLKGDQTVWEQQAVDVVGNIVVSNIRTRPVEGLVMISTHGNGVFIGGYDVGINPHINYSFQNNGTQVLLRGNVSFDANSPLGYRWMKDGQVIDGETTDELTVTDGGSYQLELFTSQTTSALSNTVVLGLDGTSPDVASIVRLNPTDESTSNTSVQFRVTFSETVLNVDATDFATSGVASGVIGTVTESTVGTVFDVTVNSVGGSGQLGLTVVSGTDITDEVGNAYSGTILAQETYTITDATAPQASITRGTPSTEVTDQNEVTFTVTFTEAVNNVDAGDFAIAAGSATSTLGTVTEASPGVYNVIVTDITEDGTVGLDFVSGQDIQDQAGNAFDGTTATDETYTIQNVITSIDDPLLRNIERIIVDANPSNGLFSLAFPNTFIGNFDMQVVDSQGKGLVLKTIKNYNSGDQVTLDLTNSPDGLYILKASNGERNASIKLLKVSSSR